MSFKFGSESYLADIYKQFASHIQQDVVFDKWIEVRHKAQRDLFYLADKILDLDVVEKPHKEMCNFFVSKDPDKPFEQQDEFKVRQMLISRGTFKSSLLVADEIQWIICFPWLSILKLTAEENLATKFVGLLKRKFTFPETGEWDKFQVFFPEFCIAPGQHGKEHEFTTPARQYVRELVAPTISPTIWADSIGSNLPGFHPNIIELDDAVNNKNAATAPLKAKVIEQIDFVDYMITPGGYKAVIGTPYATDDYYTVMRDRAKKRPGKTKFIIKPCWTVKPEAQGKLLDDLVENDVDLLFPSDKRGRPQLTFDHLKGLLSDNRAIFCSQNLCAPELASDKIPFTIELLQSRTVTLKQIPTQLTYYVAWDFGYGVKQHNDYTGTAIGAVDETGRLYVIDAFKAKYTDWALACKIIEITKQYNPYMTLIEDSMGARFLSDAIMRRAAEIGVEPKIEWFQVDRTKGAKDIRVYAMEPLLQQARMFFCMDTCSDIDEIYKALIKYSAGSKNDLADAISHLQRAVPKQLQTPQDMMTVSRILEDAKEREMERLLFDPEYLDSLRGIDTPMEAPQPLNPVDEPGLEVFDFGGS